MTAQVANWTEPLFWFATLFSMFYFHLINGKPRRLTLFIVIYAFIQALIGRTGFYTVTNSFPPRFLLVLTPMILMLVYGLLPNSRQWFITNRKLKISGFIHTVRIPVELVLHQLFLAGWIPQLMTFEGRNFDILVGLTAPIIGWLYLKNLISNKVLLLWNFVGLGFVLFIVINAILSLETPFQQFAFNQPNKAVLHFPYLLLPVVIVPIVIYTHVSDIILLLKKETQ